MSTFIANVIGSKERDPQKYEANIVPAEIIVTRFYGGEDRGQMIQLSTSKGHVQLSKNQVKYLSIVLACAFDKDVFPSE